MKRVGIIGLGDMGLAMARNIIKSGFELTGFDLREERLKLLEEAGGKRAATPAAIGSNSDAVFVMVLYGHQVESVVSGEDGLLTTMAPGSTLIVSATVNPSEVRDVASSMAEKGVEMIDTPVSGGKSGAEAGTLTMMAAARTDVFENHLDVLGAVGEKIFHVGEEIGMGQTVKASLQALIGSTFTAIFESLVLGATAGVKGKVLYDVFTASGVSSPLLEIPSGYLGRKLVDDLGSSRLKILWDPCNSLYANEPTYPDGYKALGVDGLGHIHIKDARVDMPKATVEFCELGAGDMAPYLEPLAAGLKKDGYDGMISLESVYRPDGGDFEDGFKASVGEFKRLFG